MVKIKQLPIHKRPREKLIEKGPEALSNEELLAVILRTGTQGTSVIQLSRKLLKKISLKNLINASVNDLKQIKGLGTAKITQLMAVFELAKRATESPSELALINPERVVNLLNELKNKKKEYFVAIYLNARHRLLHKEIIAIGHLSGATVHPREVFKPAIELSAASVIAAHNHPSGDLEPSKEDILLTKKLATAGEIMDIPLFDHLIISNQNWTSLKELGYFD